MKFVDEFREPELVRRTAEEIRRLADPHRHYRLMEVCGGHTHAIYRFGLKDLLPDNIELIHGPGCPVCVLPMGRIDDGLASAMDPNVIFAAFGDMMRVPGASGSPLEHKARGMDVRIVYSPSDALKLARLNPDNHHIAVALAAIPEKIRGFGHVKTRHLKAAKAEEAALLEQLRAGPATLLKAAE